MSWKLKLPHGRSFCTCMQGQTRHTLVAEEGSRLQSQQCVLLSPHCSTLFHVICTHTHAAGKGLLAGIAAAGGVLCLTIDKIDACYVALIVVNSHLTKYCSFFACWCQVRAASMSFRNFAAHSEYAVCCRSITQLQASSQMMQNYCSVRV